MKTNVYDMFKARHRTNIMFVCLIFVVQMLLLTATPFVSVGALSPTERQRLQTPFYEPDTNIAFSGVCELSGSTNAERTWNFLVGEGLTPEQAAGLLGNLEAEAPRITPTLQERLEEFSSREAAFAAERGGWGIAQWTGMSSSGPAGVRRLNIRNAVINELGRDYYTDSQLPEVQDEELLLFQLNYMVEESVSRSIRPQSHPE
ncbi:MAG: phage tail-type lysozyme domain-containing protein, partial [Actinobacteria bacterium]|nr:phage tail-type lysozyme domain-containing protein [Actinomycetota bacterium]